MKHIIAIFSVILTLGMVMPDGSWAGGACTPFACKMGEDFSELLGTDGITEVDNGGYDKSYLQGKQCYHCDINNIWGSFAYDCNHGAYVATVTATETKLFQCTDLFGDDDGWEKRDMSALSVCSNSELIRQGISNSTCVLGNRENGNIVDVVVTTFVADPCMRCSCNAKYHANADKTECILDPEPQKTCEEAPSHGQWDATNLKCLCGTGDRTDGKGEGQTYETRDAKCKCATAGYEWNESQGKCVDPNAEAIEKCKNSGGHWNGSTCECTGEMSGPDGNGMCYCTDSNKTYDGTRCVDSEQVTCTNSGGNWDAATKKCECDDGKNLKPTAGNKTCECKDSDYEWETEHKNGCKLTDAAKNRNDAFDRFMAECKRWGGTWTPDNLDDPAARDTGNWKCVCPDDRNAVGVIIDNATNAWQCKCADGYVEKKPNKCEKSSYEVDRENCAQADDVARWVDIHITGQDPKGECKCLDPTKTYVYSSHACVDGPTTQWCNGITGATIGRDGNCVCMSTRRAPVNNKCPVVNAKQTPTTADPAKDRAKQTADKIKQQIGELNKISGNFGQSHWKNADGGFNTARLASDSVAGVVLGTVGGVVTSKIIKKNQVKGGFESIKCSVGGQNVADYGDQFQVGIR